MSSQIHSVLFDNKRWLTSEARRWLKDHNIKPIKPVHKTPNFHRYRIVDPNEFKSFSTKKMDNGIELVIGYK
jgi:hypothetical protein